MWTSARPCRFRSIGNRSGREVSSIQTIRPRKRVLPICAAIMEKTRADVPESPSACRLPRAASASSMITTTGPSDRSTVSTCCKLPSVSPTYFERKFFKRHAGDADRAGVTLGQEGLARAHRPADQVAHGRHVQPALAQQPGVVQQPLLDLRLADQQVQRGRGLDELDQSLALPLDHRLLQLPKRRASIR